MSPFTSSARFPTIAAENGSRSGKNTCDFRSDILDPFDPFPQSISTLPRRSAGRGLRCDGGLRGFQIPVVE